MWFTLPLYDLMVKILVDRIEIDVAGQEGCIMFSYEEDDEGFIWSPVIGGCRACIELEPTTIELYVYEHQRLQDPIFHGVFPRK